jgi:VWFA-related protein
MRLNYISLIPLLLVVAISGQTVAPSADQKVPTLQSKVHVVLVDIVVTDHHGNPISGLTKTDFQVLEEGKPQTIASLEEHKNGLVARAQAPPPPGEFTNSPSVVSADSVNVLLIDGLNTSMQDQTFVHGQILKYLKSIPPGMQAAVFLLTTRLRMLQGFTTDSTALLAAVNSKSAKNAFASPLLQSEREKQDLQETLGFMEENHVGPPTNDELTTTVANGMDPGAALKQAFAEMEVRLTAARVGITLQAMQELGRYLTAFPGRKNVMWVSGAFPIAFLPNSALADPFFSITGFQGDIERTANLLSSARVAIYPIAAQGLMGSSTYQADNSPMGGFSSRQAMSRAGQSPQDSGPAPLARQSMKTLAEGTGGQAFYGTNGIGDVLTRVTNNSANFYTLSYTPSDRQMDGKYRHISIKLTRGKGRLSYRRGYFALREQEALRTHETDPLSPSMAFGMPDISQIVYKARVASAAKGKIENAKKDVSVPVKDSVTTYAFDLDISPDQLLFEVTPEGVHNGRIELKLVLYDEAGKLLKVVGGRFGLTFRSDEFEKMRQTGMQLGEKLEIPASGDVRLYSGICDLNSGRIGTLAVEVRARKISAAATTSQ